MKVFVANDPIDLGKMAGKTAAQLIKDAIEERGQANIIVATGNSQNEMLDFLVKDKIEWTKVVVFHLDEYIGLTDSAPASFRRYLREIFLKRTGPVKAVHYVNGEGDPQAECRRLGALIKAHPIDVALVGIGENGHLAFNDPPADFETEEPYIVVSLDESCRRQQIGEGWFETLADVPLRAISMSVKQIVKSRHIVCSVPDSRKAKAVKECLEGPVSNLHPSSILQLHKSCYCFLDKASSTLLSQTIDRREDAMTNQTS